MVSTVLKVFDGALNLGYRGAKKLLFATVAVAVVASICTVTVIAIAAAVLR